MAELERKVKSLEADRQQLENDLDDARDSLQVENQRNQNLQAQFEKLKVDTDKRIADKDEELDASRTAHRRQLEAMQNQIEENEARHKNDISSIKKKFQAEMDDLRSRYEGAKKAKIDAENTSKKYQQSNKVRVDDEWSVGPLFGSTSWLTALPIFQELLDKLTEEQHMHDLTRDQLSSAEKRASSFRAELEETKLLFDRVS